MSKQYIRIERSLLLHGNEFALSLDAMLLYAMLRDRCTLSAKNGLHDANGRIYIYCSRESAAEMVGCSVRKAVTLCHALAAAGLIREVTTGGSHQIYVKQWCEPSVLHSAESLRDGGFFDVTIDRVHVMPEDYITIDVAMLASNISNRAKVLYALLSDASRKQRQYGRDVCSIPREEAMELLNCTHNTLDATYAELTAAGYISRSARQGYGKQRAVSVASVQSPNFCASVAQNLHTSGPKIAYKPTSPINPYIAILLEPASAPRLTPPSRRRRSRKTQTMFWGCCSRVIRYVSSCVRRRCCTPTLQVLKDPGHSFSSKSYMWLYRTSGCVKQAVVLYEYQPTKKWTTQRSSCEDSTTGARGWVPGMPQATQEYPGGWVLGPCTAKIG